MLGPRSVVVDRSASHHLPPDVTLIGLKAIRHNSKPRVGLIENGDWIVFVSK